MLSAVGPGPLMGLYRQQGGSLSLDSTHIMCVSVFLCERVRSRPFVFAGVRLHECACSKSVCKCLR